jgi:SAM-dependent methyltransferase
VKLNLGSGHANRAGWLNVDRLESCSPDVVCDITKAPWPWPDSSVDRIDADNLLEHIGWGPNGEDLLMLVMNEAFRILKPGATLWFRVPSFEHWPIGALRDPTHRRYFVQGSVDYWTDGHQTYRNYGRLYGYLPWKVHVELYRPNSQRTFLDVTQQPVK